MAKKPPKKINELDTLMQEAYGKKDTIVEKARKLFKEDEEHWRPIYDKAQADLHFLSDDKYAQWDASDFDARVDANRPALTVDQLSQFIHQVVNDIRMNTPAITPIPDDDAATIETADAFKGVIRNIEYKSKADDAYDTGALFSVKSSIGFFRFDHQYATDEESFDQELVIKRMINPFAVFLDHKSIEADGRDAMHVTILEKMKIGEYKTRWPGKDISDFQDDTKPYDRAGDEEQVTVAEFFIIEEADRKIKADKDGNISEDADANEGQDQNDTPEDAPLARRTVKKRTVKRYWLSGRDELECTTFPGIYVPVIPVYGEEAWDDEGRKLLSLIRKAKGAQQMYNLWKSLETELLMKQPIAPVMAAAGQLEEFAQDWKNPSKAMALRYKTRDADGQPLQPPQRLAPPPIPTGVVNAARETVEDIKAALGMYNASVGEQGNEVSGTAINARKKEGDVATFHFADNLNRSIAHLGTCLVFAIPEVYDTARVLHIIGEEGQPKKIGINGAVVPGQKATFNLKEGKYTVKVITGASYTTRRQEAAAFYTATVAKLPEMMMVMGDLLFQNMDVAGAQEMAARMKKVIDAKNPGLIESDDPNAPQPPDPKLIQATQMIQHLQQIIQQGAQELQETKQKLANKEGELQVKMMAIQAKSSDTQAKLQADAARDQNEAQNKDGELQHKSVDAYADIQLRKRELALRERELEIQEQQVAGQLALQAQAQKMDQLLSYMDHIARNLPAMDGTGAPAGAASPQANSAAAQGGTP